MPARPDTSGRWALAHKAAAGGPLLVGFSGGGDSTALLALAAEHFGKSNIIAAVVDHAMVAGSQGRASAAVARARNLGVEAKIVTLAWPGAAPRDQNRARTARHRALARVAQAVGARVILLAHTRDDQAETALMRWARSGRWRNAAGMAALSEAPIWPEGHGLWVARPLLPIGRAALRRWMLRRGLSWEEDPANQDLGYARVRARALLQAMPGFAVRLARLAVQRRARMTAAGVAAWRQFGVHVVWGQGRAACPEPPEGPAGVVGLCALLLAVSGERRAPAPEAVARLAARMRAAPADRSFAGATLGGCVVSPQRGRGYLVQRDPGAVLGRVGGAGLSPQPLPLEVWTPWDGRLMVRAKRTGLAVGAGGQRLDPTAPVFMGLPHPLDAPSAVAAGAVELDWLGPGRFARHLLGAGALDPLHRAVTLMDEREGVQRGLHSLSSNPFARRSHGRPS